MEKDKQGYPIIVNATMIGCFLFGAVAWYSFGKELMKEMKGKGRG